MRKCIIAVSFILLSLVTVPVAAESSYVGLGEAYGYGEEAGTGSYLGVDISDVTTERLSALKLKDERGVEVTMVDQELDSRSMTLFSR